MRHIRPGLRLRLPFVVAAALSSALLGCGEELPDAPRLAPTAIAQQALAPANTLPPPQTTNEDTRLTFGLDNPLTVSDDDNTNTQVQITVTNGTFTVVPKQGVTVTGNGTPDVILTGPIAGENSVNGALFNAYYQPGTNFSGSAQLQMHSQDTNGESDIDVLPITVTPFNDPPTLTVPTATQNATEDTPFAVSVTANDVDLDGGAILVSLSSTNGTTMTLPGTSGLTFTSGDGAGDAAMAFSGTLPDVNSALNGLTVTPPANFVGNSSVSVSVNDDGQSGEGDPGVDLEVVNFKWNAVNDAPVNTVPPQQTIDEDTSLTFQAADGTALGVGDVDATTTLLQVTLSVTNGTLTLGSIADVTFLSGDGTSDPSMVFTGTLTQLNTALAGTRFAPTTNFAGTAVLSLVTSDLGNSGTGGARQDSDQVSIVVEGVNDAPVNAVPPDQFASEDVALTFANLARITVADVDAAQLQLTLTASNGTLTLPSTNGLVFQTGDGAGDASMTFTGTVAAINTALNGLQFLSTPNFSGDGSVTITSADLGFTGAGGPLADTDVIDVAIAPVNDPPSASNDGLELQEDDGASALSPLLNDTAAPDVGETLTIVSVTQPANGTVTYTASEVTYTPDPDFHGSDTFNYTVSDGVLTDVAIVTATVAPVNDAPTAVDDAVTISQETSTVLSLLANDTGAPDVGETLTITAVTTPTSGTAVIDAGGTTVQYTPNDGFVGEDSFQYTLSDGALTATALVTITVTEVNTTPVNTLPAPQTTSEDVALTFSSGDGSIIRVADGNNTTLTVFLQVTNGTFTLATTTGLTTVTANGTSFVTAKGPVTALNAAFEGAFYTPAANFNGTATLTMSSSDSEGNSDEDTLALTVTAINDGPVNTAPTAVQTGTEDTPRPFSNLSVSDTDVATGNLQVSLVASNGTVVTLGSTTGLSFDVGDGVEDGTVTFAGALIDVNAALNGLTVVPPANFIGGSTLSITSNDLGNVGAGGAKQDVDLVSISWSAANDPPINRLPQTASTDEDTPLVFTVNDATEIRVSDQDAGGASIRVTLSVTNGTLSLADPSLVAFEAGDGTADTTMTMTASLATLNGAGGEDGALEGLVFEPAPGYAGNASLTITTNDAGYTGGNPRTDSDTLTITVNAVNDPPVNVVPLAQATPEDTVLQLSSATGNVVSVSDPDAATLQVALSAENGTLTLASVTGLAFQAGDGTADATLTFRGTAGNINAALGGLRFVPTPDFSGVGSVTVRTDDLGSTGIGGPAFDEDSFEVFISPVSDVPVAQNDSYVVDEDAAATAFEVLTNDTTQPDLGETLSVVSVTVPTRGGTATIDGSTIRYQPLANFFGTERFDYTVSDGTDTATARVTITVNRVNDLPIAADDAVSVARNSIASVLSVLDNDTDAEGASALEITATTTPSQGTLTLDTTGRELRYTPTPGYFGPDSFEYTVTDADGASDTATVSITVEEGVNALPAAAADAVTMSEDSPGQNIDVVANDDGVADAPLTVAIVTPPARGTATVEADNTVRYRPNPDFSGTDTLSYAVTDADGDSSQAAVVITVTPVDDTPAAGPDEATTEEDTSVNIVVIANDNGLGDTSSPVLTIATQSTSGTAVVEDDNSITFEPAADYVGQTFFVYTVSDGEQSSNAVVTVLVTPVADAPEAAPDTAATRAGEPVDIDVLANDVDADGDTLTLVSVVASANGSASIVDGLVRYVPAEGFEGSDQLEYTIDDGTELTAVGTVVIGVGLDGDADGLIDLDETDRGTDPADEDSDDDLIPDGVEVHVAGSDPLDDDSDDDGLLDGNEDADRDGAVDEGETNPLDFDSDQDLISDGVERGVAEPEGDGTDAEVFVPDADPSTTSDPTNADSDGDGVKDGQEDLNRNGRVDIAEQDPAVDDVEPPPPPPPEDEGGCSAMPGDSALAALALLALLGRVRRRRR